MYMLQMIFRRCSVIGKDFGGQSVVAIEGKTGRGRVGRHSKDRGLEALLATTVKAVRYYVYMLDELFFLFIFLYMMIIVIPCSSSMYHLHYILSSLLYLYAIQ